MARAPETRTIDVDAGQVRADGNTLRGHAAVFDVLSEDLGGYRERIAPGAFTGVLDADVRLLVNHKPDHVLARTKSGTLRLSQDDTGLLVEADLPDTSYARDLRESVRRGDVDGMSFRFEIGDETWDGDTRTVRSVKRLEDVCLATYPAYPPPPRWSCAAGRQSPTGVRLPASGSRTGRDPPGTSTRRSWTPFATSGPVRAAR